MNALDYTMTLQGRVNRYSDIACQDMAARAASKEVTALSLCDGAGSLKMGGTGAETMSKTFAQWMMRNFRRLIRMSEQAVIDEAVCLIERTLSALSCAYRIDSQEFGSTLLVGACDQRGRWLVLHLGDGIIAGVDRQENVFAVSEPEGYRNATYLTCCDRQTLREHLRLRKVKNLRGLFMSSDGSEGILHCVDANENSFKVTVSSDIASLMNQLEEDRRLFGKEFPDFVDKEIRPLDDFSVAMLIPLKNDRERKIYHGLRNRMKTICKAHLQRPTFNGEAEDTIAETKMN